MDNPLVNGNATERWHCAAPLRWPTTSKREIRLPRHRRSRRRRHSAAHLGLRSQVQVRDERLQPGPRHGAVGYVRLCGQGRRRLARHARRQSAGARSGNPVRPTDAPARRAVEEEHGRGGHPDRVQNRQVARKPQGGPCRQSYDVGLSDLPRRPTASAASRERAYGPHRRQGQPRALSARRVRPDLRADEAAAERRRAAGAVRPDRAAHDGLRALSDLRAPHPHRHELFLAHRLPAAAVLARLVAVR